MPTYQYSYTATLASTPFHIVTKQENLKEEEDVKNEIPTKTPLCKKVEVKNLKKAMLKKM